jgi:serine protease Do
MYEDSTPPNVEPTSVDVHGNWPTPPNAPASAKRVAVPLKVPRLNRLLWIFAPLFAVLVAPSVAGRIQYALTAAKERAQYDFAREHHQELNLNQISNASRLLAQFVGPSVVNVGTDRGRGQGQGSGVIVDADGYIVTNYHVVYGVDTVEVQLSDGRRGPASVVGRDPLVDVAVLKTELDNLIPAEWGDSDELAVGEMVWALGSPYGLQRSITFGILSAKERRGYNTPRNSVYQEFLQTDAAVNPGNSGGPLVNSEGKVIGINTAIIGESYQGISFSIPSTIARQSYEQLRRDGWVQRGWLGVEPSRVTDRDSRRLGLKRDQGVLVVRVEKNTPADDAGMKMRDVILSWNGVEFSDPTLMSRAIAATTIGSEVPVEIVRRGDNGPERLTLSVTVAARPRNDSL